MSIRFDNTKLKLSNNITGNTAPTYMPARMPATSLMPTKIDPNGGYKPPKLQQKTGSIATAGAVQTLGTSAIGTGLQLAAKGAANDYDNSYSRTAYGVSMPDFKKERKALHAQRASSAVSTGMAAGGTAAAALTAAGIIGTGAALGAWAGPAGVGAGALAGLVYYFATKNKDNKTVDKHKMALTGENTSRMLDQTRAEDRNYAGTYLKARAGMRVPGVLGNDSVLRGKPNVILRGKLHKENNNLGNKDKGIPIITSSGEKIFEFERDEWVLHREAASKQYGLISKYKKTGDQQHLIDLGKLTAKELLHKTKDNSNKL
jgi:uncharacterized protein (DUF2147 family)